MLLQLNARTLERSQSAENEKRSGFDLALVGEKESGGDAGECLGCRLFFFFFLSRQLQVLCDSKGPYLARPLRSAGLFDLFLSFERLTIACFRQISEMKV